MPADALIVYPPTRRIKYAGDPRPSVFLGGSIDMGEANDHQAVSIERLKSYTSLLYNPRRPNWDSSWKQAVDSPEFNTQVWWELDMIEAADFVTIVFEPDSKAPISLLEVGIACAAKPGQTYIACPEGFYRKGNVQITAERFGAHFFHRPNVMLDALVRRIQTGDRSAPPGKRYRF